VFANGLRSGFYWVFGGGECRASEQRKGVKGPSLVVLSKLKVSKAHKKLFMNLIFTVE